MLHGRCVVKILAKGTGPTLVCCSDSSCGARRPGRDVQSGSYPSVSGPPQSGLVGRRGGGEATEAYSVGDFGTHEAITACA